MRPPLQLEAHTIHAGTEDALTVDVRTSSEATLARRKQVSEFLHRSHFVMGKLPPGDTGLLATPEVLEEVIHCAQAFHVEEDNGSVDMLWVKKDIPEEAIKDARVGYWRGLAGAGPRCEQSEITEVRDIPLVVMDHIREHNDLNFIAHFLYAFLDFWCINLRHYLIWIACLFWYGWLCICRPLIIVGESSKLYNIVKTYPGSTFFAQGIQEQEFEDFLMGEFNLDFCKLLVCGVSTREWDEYMLSPLNYIQTLGSLTVIQYGPALKHSALYIAKYHPYGAYHIPTLGQFIMNLDRVIRLLAELSLRVMQSEASIPFDDTRPVRLKALRIRIMKEAADTGLTAELVKAKQAIYAANKGFLGAGAVLRERDESVPHSESSMKAGKRPERGNICARGPKGSQDRKTWVIEAINQVREQLERGQVINLLACPAACSHGSDEHASWLFHNVGEDAEVISSASGYNKLGPALSEEDAKTQKALYDKVAEAKYKQNPQTVDFAGALASLAAVVPVAKPKLAPLPASDKPEASTSRETGDSKGKGKAKSSTQPKAPKPKDKPPTSQIYCQHCKTSWFVKGGITNARHDCVTIRETTLPLYELAKREEDERMLLKQVEQMGQKQASDPELGVTRVGVSFAMSWPMGTRLSDDDELFEAPLLEMPKENRRPTKNDPTWMRIMDDRGRLTPECVVVRRLFYPFQLLEIQSRENHIEGKATSSETVPKIAGYTSLSISQAMIHYGNSPTFLAGFTKRQIKDAKSCHDGFLYIPIDGQIADIADDEANSAESSSEEGVKKKPSKGKGKVSIKLIPETQEERNLRYEKWARTQIISYLKEVQPIETEPIYDLEAIRDAAVFRLSMDRLTPCRYDRANKLDLLKASQK